MKDQIRRLIKVIVISCMLIVVTVSAGAWQPEVALSRATPTAACSRRSGYGRRRIAGVAPKLVGAWVVREILLHDAARILGQVSHAETFVTLDHDLQ